MKNMSDILDRIMAVLYSPEIVDKKKILVVSKYTERTRVNLILLKFFLEEMNMRGIFITIDRPHQYIEYLLKLHGIPQDKLLYIDVVSHLSGEIHLNDSSNVFFMDGPYEVGFLDKAMDECYEPQPVIDNVPKDYVNLKEMDFILVDDIAALSKYLDDDGIKKFIDSYMMSIRRLATVIAPLVLDINKNKEMFNILKQNCESIIFINLMKSMVKEVQCDSKVSKNSKISKNLKSSRKVQRKVKSSSTSRTGV